MTDYIMHAEEINETLSLNKTVSNPWRRYFARHLDLMIYEIVWVIIQLFVLRIGSNQSTGGNILDLLIGLVLMMLIEPVLLSTIGTTPGKWIYGLVVRDNMGGKLSHREAFERTWIVIKSGLGFGIPFYSLYRYYKSYSMCKSGEVCDWEIDYSYEIKDTKVWRMIAYIGASILVFMVIIVLVAMSMLPINRGPITSQEFYENYNDMMKYNDVDLGYTLNLNGEWVAGQEDDNVITIHIFDNVNPTFEVYEVDGLVNEVVMTMESTDNSWIGGGGTHVFLAYMSYAGSKKGINPIGVIDNEMKGHINNCYEDFEVVKNGISISNVVEYEGYTLAGSRLIANDGESQNFKMVFRMKQSSY